MRVLWVRPEEDPRELQVALNLCPPYPVGKTRILEVPVPTEKGESQDWSLGNVRSEEEGNLYRREIFLYPFLIKYTVKPCNKKRVSERNFGRP